MDRIMEYLPPDQPIPVSRLNDSPLLKRLRWRGSHDWAQVPQSSMKSFAFDCRWLRPQWPWMIANQRSTCMAWNWMVSFPGRGTKWTGCGRSFKNCTPRLPLVPIHPDTKVPWKLPSLSEASLLITYFVRKASSCTDSTTWPLEASHIRMWKADTTYLSHDSFL
ncbi:hypothetical protein LIER_12657 [Lithospermum erythrorhizon]|uniref:Uncharacterized protein n=1 Tax=Lithospermum erythrorhizon TaxID=34254 RepID=A0AAV3PSQ7_LITER